MKSPRLIHPRGLVIASALLCALVTPPAPAALVLLDNTAQFAQSPENVGAPVAGSARVALIFSAAAALDLTSVAVGLFSGELSPGQGVFGLYNVDGSGNPTGTAIAAVTIPPTPVNISETPTYYSFGLSGMAVSAAQSYALVLSDYNLTTGGAVWARAALNLAPTGSNGIGFIGYRSSSDNGSTWSPSTENYSIYLAGEPSAIPEPASVALVGTALAGLLALRHRRRGATADA